MLVTFRGLIPCKMKEMRKHFGMCVLNYQHSLRDDGTYDMCVDVEEIRDKYYGSNKQILTFIANLDSVSLLRVDYDHIEVTV